MSVIIETASVTDKGLNPVKSTNEDSYLSMKNERVFAVADGVGGAHAGDVASQSALDTIKKMVFNLDLPKGQNVKNSIGIIKELISAGNSNIYQIGRQRRKKMATTIAIMIVANDYAILGNVGDSRIYIARDNKLMQVTKDHSILQTLIDNHPQKKSLNRKDFKDGHVITKALGAEANVEPEVQKVMLKNDDIFILCTDGIYIHNSNDEMLSNVKKNRDDLKKICQVFKDNCYNKGAKDHLTAIVVRFIIKNDKHLNMPNDLRDTIIK